MTTAELYQTSHVHCGGHKDFMYIICQYAALYQWSKAGKKGSGELFAFYEVRGT